LLPIMSCAIGLESVIVT